jgi:S1-C subfamily serine protease
MQSRKLGLWLAGCLIITISLFAGTLMGGMAGYVVARDQVWPTQSGAITAPGAILTDVAEQPVANLPPVAPESQTLIVTEESELIEAVQQVLPAVVTVINQSQRGTGSGSGFFISDDGYIVMNPLLLG